MSYTNTREHSGGMSSCGVCNSNYYWQAMRRRIYIKYKYICGWYRGERGYPFLNANDGRQWGGGEDSGFVSVQ